jgi:hypothetical protein
MHPGSATQPTLHNINYATKRSTVGQRGIGNVASRLCAVAAASTCHLASAMRPCHRSGISSRIASALLARTDRVDNGCMPPSSKLEPLRPRADGVAFVALGTAITAGVAALFAIAVMQALARRAASTWLLSVTAPTAVQPSPPPPLPPRQSRPTLARRARKGLDQR